MRLYIIHFLIAIAVIILGLWSFFDIKIQCERLQQPFPIQPLLSVPVGAAALLANPVLRNTQNPIWMRLWAIVWATLAAQTLLWLCLNATVWGMPNVVRMLGTLLLASGMSLVLFQSKPIQSV